jgi:MarR family transcriptional regulator, lower aerobic nicotinate degradation pathway regulator
MRSSPSTQDQGQAPNVVAGLDLMDALAQLTFMVQGALAKRAGAHDLSLIQTRLLGVLRDRDPTMQELARLLELDKSSVTGLIDRAERRGLVQRDPSRDDRRSVRVKLTPAGRRIAQKVVTAFQHDIDTVTADLTSTEKHQLRQLAARIITASATSPGQQ